jgi:hypothetical protein
MTPPRVGLRVTPTFQIGGHPLAVRELTQHLIEALAADEWPRAAAIVDFGIDSADHLGALQWAYLSGHRSPEDFDAALGSGAKLTELCRVPRQRYVVTFETSYDRMAAEGDEEDVEDEEDIEDDAAE